MSPIIDLSVLVGTGARALSRAQAIATRLAFDNTTTSRESRTIPSRYDPGRNQPPCFSTRLEKQTIAKGHPSIL